MKNIQSIIFTAAATVAAILLRCLQLAFMVEPATGFTVENMAVFSGCITGFILLLCLLSAVFCFAGHLKTGVLKLRSSWILAVCSVLFGASLILELVLNGTAIYNVPNLLCFLRAFFLVFCGLVYLYNGVCLFLGYRVQYGLTVVPTVLWVLRLMCTFINHTVMSNITENFYDIGALIFTLLFFMYHGKALCGVKPPKSALLMRITGCIAIILNLTATVPHFCLTLFGVTGFNRQPVDHPLSAVLTAFYIAAFLCCSFTEEKAKIS